MKKHHHAWGLTKAYHFDKTEKSYGDWFLVSRVERTFCCYTCKEHKVEVVELRRDYIQNQEEINGWR